MPSPVKLQIDNDPDLHPCHVAYRAGIEAGNAGVSESEARAKAKWFDDGENFMDGYWEALDR